MKQRDFGWLAEVPPPVSVSAELLAHCHTAHDAILLTWNSRKVKCSQNSAAERLEMPASHLSNILSGSKYLPDDLRVPFMWLCGNLALRQYEDRQMAELGLDLKRIKLEQELAEVIARRAA